MKPTDGLRAEVERVHASSEPPKARVQLLTTLLNEVESLRALCDSEPLSAELHTPGGKEARAHIEELEGQDPEQRFQGLAALKTELRTLAGIITAYRNDARLQA